MKKVEPRLQTIPLTVSQTMAKEVKAAKVPKANQVTKAKVVIRNLVTKSLVTKSLVITRARIPKTMPKKRNPAIRNLKTRSPMMIPATSLKTVVKAVRAQKANHQKVSQWKAASLRWKVSRDNLGSPVNPEIPVNRISSNLRVLKARHDSDWKKLSNK